MKWFTELDELIQYSLVIAFVSILGIIGTFIVCHQEQSIQKAAIEAGLHQEVVDGKVVWVK